MGIKSAVKEWCSEKFDSWVKQPIAKKTEELEGQARQQYNTYSSKVQAQAYKPKDYYDKQPAFYRGLFWIAVACLVVLWVISGS